MKALVISSSPRRDGNSAALAREAVRGLQNAQHDAKLLHLEDVLNGFLRDCRTCRGPDGRCSINDNHGDVFLNDLLPADGLIVASPVYWYGMSGQLKAFFDRMFCYVAASYPASDEVVARLQNKRIGLILSSEETFPTVSAGIVHQIQEYARYTRSEFAGVVHGFGNARGDVARDPGNPLLQAHRFGETFFSAPASDYKIDTPRPGKLWTDRLAPYPGTAVTA
ncbi:MAG: flavodoxin family protein [Pseudomonadota bacterium]